ncbi:MAG: hypothetical protein JNL32_15005, partial [Candidatus Kapabacteria bacterium]|nr:hypothetical protein [Candidatus Kapabacteria bacterium]
ILQRDLRMRETFLINLAWFGTMGAMSLWMIGNGTLRTYNDMVTIALAGVSMSSAAAVLLTWKQLRFSTDGTVALLAVLRFASPQALMVALSNSIRQLDILLVQVYFGLPASGVYNSAKMFYRVFETATDAGIALMYPAAVRLFAQKRESSIITIFSKAISFILIPTIGAVVILELGATDLLVGLLGEKFRAAAPQFNVMILGALFLPFFILQSVELAQHYTGKLLRHVVISMVCGLLTFYVLGKMQLATWFPLGIVAYSCAFAVQLVWSVRSELHFPLSDIFRAVPDALSFVRDFRAVGDK